MSKEGIIRRKSKVCTLDNQIKRSWLRISHSKVFSSGHLFRNSSVANKKKEKKETRRIPLYSGSHCLLKIRYYSSVKYLYWRLEWGRTPETGAENMWYGLEGFKPNQTFTQNVFVFFLIFKQLFRLLKNMIFCKMY